MKNGFQIPTARGQFFQRRLLFPDHGLQEIKVGRQLAWICVISHSQTLVVFYINQLILS